MTTHSLAVPPRATDAGQPMSERTLDATHLAAMRAARAALLDAARRGASPDIEAALPPFVHSMWCADFTRQTISSLVAAAIDAGLPSGRGAARRAQRARTLAEWTERAGRIADQLSEYAPARML